MLKTLLDLYVLCNCSASATQVPSFDTRRPAIFGQRPWLRLSLHSWGPIVVPKVIVNETKVFSLLALATLISFFCCCCTGTERSLYLSEALPKKFCFVAFGSGLFGSVHQLSLLRCCNSCVPIMDSRVNQVQRWRCFFFLSIKLIYSLHRFAHHFVAFGFQKGLWHQENLEENYNPLN